MNVLKICTALYLMIIYVFGVCDAKCDEYIIIFEETTCPRYKIRPQNPRDINWGGITYPCNSTDIRDKIIEKKECILELTCSNTILSCMNRIKPKNYQTHSFISGNNTMNHAEHRNKPLDVPKENITEQKKPNKAVATEIDTLMYNVNLIYINKNDTNDKKSKDCEYAETICINDGKPENHGLIDIKTINNTHLNIIINRDKNSPIKPKVTGSFPELPDIASTYDFTRKEDYPLKDMTTENLTCKTFKDYNCKQEIGKESIKQINVYIKANNIHNNTMKNYSNCTGSLITTINLLQLKCHDIHTYVHNKTDIKSDIKTKQDLFTWYCNISEINDYLSTKELNNKNNEIYFKFCSNEMNSSKNITLKTVNKNPTIDDVITKGGIKMKNSEISSEKTAIHKSNRHTNPENTLTIIITEKASNCSQNTLLNIHEGKIIDLEKNNNKEKILQNNNLELNLSNCINVNDSIINSTQPHPKAELTIFLKKDSLNSSNLKLVKEIPKDANVKHKIILRCDHPNRDLSNNTSNKTTLQCESIDLDDYDDKTDLENNKNISPPSDNKTTIKSDIKTKQDLFTWYCKVIELNNSLSTKEHNKNSEIYFEICSNEINETNGYHNITQTTNKKNPTIDDIITKEGNKSQKSETSGEKSAIHKFDTHKNPKNIITIVITEKASNCSQNTYLNIHKGKIIDLNNNNNKEKLLKNNNLKLNISNCINVNDSIINNPQPHAKAELTIFLKNDSLNTSNLKLFDEIPKAANDKQKIILRCDYPNHVLISNTSTELQCESIDLDDYSDITDLENNKDLSQSLNNKIAIKSDIEIEKDLFTWHCKVMKLNDSLSTQEQRNKNSEIYFKMCSKEINYSKNSTGDHNITPKTDNIITIVIKQKASNCSQNTLLNIHKGKIIDIDKHNNKKIILQNNNLELNLSNCINVNESNINSTQPHSKAELTIFLKNDSLNASNLKLFDDIPKAANDKQKIILRCDYPNHVLISNTSTELQCESIDLDDYSDITDLETHLIKTPNASKEKKKDSVNRVEENHKQTKVKAEVNRNSTCSANKTIESNECTSNNTSTKNNTKVVGNREVQNNDKRKAISKNVVFNRKSDIANIGTHESLAIESAGIEKIILITLSSIAGVSILLVLALKACDKKIEYHVTPTREPPDNEDTAL